MKYHVRIKITSAVCPPRYAMRDAIRKWLGSIHRWIWEWEMTIPDFERVEREIGVIRRLL